MKTDVRFVSTEYLQFIILLFPLIETILDYY